MTMLDPLVIASPRAARLLSAILTLAALGCPANSVPGAGQSGSEDVPGDGSPGGATVPCPCENENALRVTVLTQDHGNLSLRVEEVLHGDLALKPGDVIVADRYDDTFACSRGCAAIKNGEQAFAFYRPAEPALPPCTERDRCIADCAPGGADDDSYDSGCTCRAAPPDDLMTVTGHPTCGVPVIGGLYECKKACAESTREQCPPRPPQDYKRGSVMLSPWAERIVFARTELGEISLPHAELGKLWEEGCRERVGDWSRLLRNAP